MNIWDEWINNSVSYLKEYIHRNNLKSIVLGISGGIDSTVSAVICYLATKDNPGCTFIGRSLPTLSNDYREVQIAESVGKVLCDDFETVSIDNIYKEFRKFFYYTESEDKADNIGNGNLKARLRMMYLYQLAYNYKGMVIDTDNLTEHELGFYTIHGDVGDYNVGIRHLYKHSIWELAKVLIDYVPKAKEAIESSISLAPTDGNTGGTDLDQIAPGATYADVDCIIASLEDRKDYRDAIEEYGLELVKRVEDRVIKNSYKDRLPISPECG